MQTLGFAALTPSYACCSAGSTGTVADQLLAQSLCSALEASAYMLAPSPLYQAL